MKIFLLVLMFVIVFFTLQSFVEPWFLGHTGVKTLFSITVSGVLVMTGFGIMDMLMPGKKD